MASTAPGQLLGYSLQFPRALLRLLEIGTGEAVGIEINGDVSVFFPEGIALSEEDKSSISGNPLTNHSTNLWKTFYNWCCMLKAEELSAANMRFVLYTNHPVGDNSYAKWFNKAETAEAISNITSNLRDFFKTISSAHEIYKYLDPLLNEYEDIFRQIVLNFELVENCDTDEIYNDIQSAIRRKMVPEAYIEPLLESLTGWLQTEVNKKIARREPAIITFDEMNHKFSAYCQRLRQKALIDLAINNLPDSDSLRVQAETRPVYVRQLEAINIEFGEIIEAVSDYYLADTNRQVWIDEEIIDEDAMKDFQQRLVSFHSNHQRSVELTQRAASEEERGQILLYACKERRELLNELTPPDRTIQGTYHVLSNEKILGWHPHWKNIIENNEGALE